LIYIEARVNISAGKMDGCLACFSITAKACDAASSTYDAQQATISTIALLFNTSTSLTVTL
jgi:hypothetical protein